MIYYIYDLYIVSYFVNFRCIKDINKHKNINNNSTYFHQLYDKTYKCKYCLIVQIRLKNIIFIIFTLFFTIHPDSAKLDKFFYSIFNTILALK